MLCWRDHVERPWDSMEREKGPAESSLPNISIKTPGMWVKSSYTLQTQTPAEQHLVTPVNRMKSGRIAQLNPTQIPHHKIVVLSCYSLDSWFMQQQITGTGMASTQEVGREFMVHLDGVYIQGLHCKKTKPRKRLSFKHCPSPDESVNFPPPPTPAQYSFNG